MKTIPSLLFAATVLLASCGTEKKKDVVPSGKDPIPVKVIAIEKKASQREIRTSGQFTTNDETMLSFKTGGVINGIYVKEGDRVKKGQLLATLDLTEISAQVNLATLGHEKADRDYKRVQNLYRDSVATLEQLQNSKTALDLAQQQLDAAQFNLRYSEIRAVNDGVILKKFANAGQVIGGGMPVFQTNSAGNSDWILKVGVSDREWAQIRINDKATVQTDAEDGKTIDASVTSKSEGADPFTGSFTIELKIANSKTNAIAAGMFGKATIYPSDAAACWSIPYEALLDGNGNTGYVFVTNDKKTAEKVPVKIGTLQEDRVIISEGLENATLLIVSGSAYLAEHSPIRIIQ